MRAAQFHPPPARLHYQHVHLFRRVGWRARRRVTAARGGPSAKCANQSIDSVPRPMSPRWRSVALFRAHGLLPATLCGAGQGRARRKGAPGERARQEKGRARRKGAPGERARQEKGRARREGAPGEMGGRGWLGLGCDAARRGQTERDPVSQALSGSDPRRKSAKAYPRTFRR